MGLRERKKAQKRQEIVNAALVLFAQHGFKNVTVTAIAQQAHITPKTLFTYFNSKADIIFCHESDLLVALQHLIQQQTSIANVWPTFHQFIAHLPLLAATKQATRDMQQLIKQVNRMPELKDRYFQMWAHYIDGLQNTLIQQRLADQLTAYIFAQQMVLILQMMFAPEVTLHNWEKRTTYVFTKLNQVATLTNRESIID
uniref:Transcriptional regulator, TetR family n=1 Tax=Loigolactobacillus rennini TaxID=238013 RepID=A0A1K2I971_9LACO|nr:Transcriptional regulator, TetR family [Loigolactobacillus rennini]